MSYTVAFWGFVLGFFGVVGLTCSTGVRLDVALALWIGYLIFAIGLSRVAVEGGMLSLITDSAPLGIAARLFGTNPSAWLSFQAGIVPASFVQAAFAVHMRGFIMPSDAMCTCRARAFVSLLRAVDRKAAAQSLPHSKVRARRAAT